MKDTKEIQPGVHLGEKALVFDRIRETSATEITGRLPEIMDSAMKEWGILPEDTGYVEGRLISDTKEIVFDPDHARSLYPHTLLRLFQRRTGRRDFPF